MRPLRWWDVEALMPLERELFGDTAWTAEMFWSELAHPETRWYVVAESEGEILGYAGLFAPGAEADVQTIAVAPAAQGQGLGRALLGALTETARERGATTLLLEVRADNASAVRLYERSGFERIAVRHRYYQPGDIDAWIMRRRPIDHSEEGATP
ncbi:ribosomal protein S18-alanine N-acetyltransferase [Kineosporia succinea]|uniref:[Ribosomal protein bS18]-alanine N-acetyltransferase n=1 Tax=Kineosporia succinea TaxID=84632 RepID=A0ABT9P3F4_9ACTN|nr:ribosomal protein S18-alanine N-acetyltransferase [Kineosporia succinea]MDP9827230.1 ribosomal-protein-alanine N-acetyltransferase [Kineosporia succinea]